MTVLYLSGIQTSLKRWLHRSMPVLCLLLVFHHLKAEGTREVAPSPTDIVMLLTNRPDFSDFASFGGPEDSRLYFSIGDASEVLHLGLSAEFDELGNPLNTLNASRYRFRIKRVNPGGADPVVHGPFQVDMNKANIFATPDSSHWDRAGFPNYNTSDPHYRFEPDQAGDYYIEFDDEGADGDGKVLIGYWDFTVTNNAGNPIGGRVWSKNWAFRTPVEDGTDAGECGWDRKFNGALYSYTVDGFVSKIDFMESGFQGLAFTVAFNMTGPGTSGDFAEDRKSVEGVNATDNAAMHKIFVNEPDPKIFPDGECGQVLVSDNFSCSSGDPGEEYCLEVEVTRPGQVDIILDFNNNGQFDPNSEDVNLVTCFEEGDPLTQCIPWDGVKGDGSTIEFGDSPNVIYRYTQGIQHWAVYDGEFLKRGFCVEAVRPMCGTETTTNILYWDDREIAPDPGTGAPKDGRAGCECGAENCRSWDFFNPNNPCDQLVDSETVGYGDKSTLNTWWFASVTETSRSSVPLLTCKIEGNSSICANETTEFTADVSSGTSNLTYSWSGPEGYAGSDEAGSGALSIPGEYCVTVTDEFGCQTSCCLTLEVKDNPTLTCTPTDVDCQGGENGQIEASATGGAGDYQYALGDGDFQDAGLFTGLPAGTYTITVIDGEGCTGTCEVTVDQPNGLSCSASEVEPVSCNGGDDGSATVNVEGGNGGYTYEWDNGQTSQQATGLDAGTHSVTVTDAKGCFVVCDVIITEPDALTCSASETAPVSCKGGDDGQATASAQGGNGGYTYEWDNGQTGATADELDAGPHSVTITDSKGCTVVCEVTITEPETLTCTASETAPVSCNGGDDGKATASAQGGNGGYTYEWDNGQTSQQATGLDAGAHSVTITDSKGCTVVCEVVISEPDALTCTIEEQKDVRCNGESNGSATVAAQGGNGGYAYAWDNGETGATADNLDAGPHDLTITDSKGCSTVCSVDIKEPAPLTCQLTGEAPASCEDNEDGSATAFPEGGNGNYSYQWDNGETTPTATMLGAGLHTVTITDEEGCKTSCSITIGLLVQLECKVELLEDISCQGGSDGKAKVTVTGGGNQYSYEWDNGETTQTATMLDSGEHSVTVTDENGCTTSCSVFVPEPEASIVCPDDLTLDCGDPDNDAIIQDWLNSAKVINACEDAEIKNDYDKQAFAGKCVESEVITFTYHIPGTDEVLTCQAKLTIIDDEAPEIVCPPDLLLDCKADLPKPDFGGGAVSDNCSEPGEKVCDTDYSDCAASSFLGRVDNPDGSVTYRFEVKNTCSVPLSYVEFALPEGAQVLDRPDGSTYVGSQGVYKIKRPGAGNYYNYLRFTAQGEGISNYQSDIFTFTLPGTVSYDEAFVYVKIGVCRYCLHLSTYCTYEENSGGLTVEWVGDEYNDASGCGEDTIVVRRKYRATDACGNTSYCYQKIKFEPDNQSPVLIPKTEELKELESGDTLVVECQSPHDPAVAGPRFTKHDMKAEDDCGKPWLSFTDYIIAEGDCEKDGFFYLTRCAWKATDDCGNVTEFVLYSKVVDNTAPQFTNLPPEKAYVDCEDLATPPQLSATDACSGRRVDYEEEWLDDYVCNDNQPDLLRKWTAVDGCGNTNTFTQKVFVVDNEKPRARFRTNTPYGYLSNGSILSLTCGEVEDLLADAEQLVTVSDNCDDQPSLEVKTEQTGSIICGNAWGYGNEPNLKLTWVVTDQCGNVFDDLAIYVKATDNEPPVIHNAPPDICVTELPEPPADVYATDLCSEAQLTFTETGPTSGRSGEQIVERIWTATDGCGNTTRVTQKIRITPMAPQITLRLNPETTPCNSRTNTLYAEVSGGQRPYTYQWVQTSGDAQITSGDERNVLTFSFNGQDSRFFVLVTDQSGCTAYASITVSCGQGPGEGEDPDEGDDPDQGEDSDEEEKPGEEEDSGEEGDEEDGEDEGEAGVVAIENLPEDRCYGMLPPFPDSVRATSECGILELTVSDHDTVVTNKLGGFQVTRTWQAVDSCGNTADSSRVITVIADGPVAEMRYTPESPYCERSSNQVVATVTGGQRPYTYDWRVVSGDIQFQTPSDNNFAVFYLGPKTEEEEEAAVLEFVVEDADGCLAIVRDTLSCQESGGRGRGRRRAAQNPSTEQRHDLEQRQEDKAESLPSATGQPPATQKATPRVDLWPNPAQSRIFLNLNGYAGQSGKVELYNAQGALSARQELDLIPTEPVRLDIAQFQNGLYLVVIRIEGEELPVTKRLIIGNGY